MPKLTAKLLFALSAASFVIPSVLIQMYESIEPMPYNPGTFVANDTMQILLSTGDLLSDLGILLFVVGIILWYRES
ncbi:MAG: hypothetical protein G01um10148_28 [Parcubacteria group bacterium Gr01-1014_8]|nr:MAG: hypothetical protein G01um10148_28 [Parcubacteria group bacterium Gr01-1014_8]